MPVMEIREKVLGPEHPDTLISMHSLALTWKSQGRDAEALGLMEECCRLRKQRFGPDHPLTVSTLDVLNKWNQR